MRGAVSVVASTKIEHRVAFLCRDYAHIIAEPARLDPLLDWVITRLGHDIVDGWRQLIAVGDWPGFVRAVLDDHYDPAYDKSAARRNHEIIATIDAGTLDAAAIDNAADQLLPASCTLRFTTALLKRGLYPRFVLYNHFKPFPGSSAVEQATVNRLAGGSIRPGEPTTSGLAKLRGHLG